MTRREFLRRSAPLIASGLVSTSFAKMVCDRLFGPPKQYWDMGAANQKSVNYLYHNLLTNDLLSTEEMTDLLMSQLIAAWGLPSRLVKGYEDNGYI